MRHPRRQLWTLQGWEASDGLGSSCLPCTMGKWEAKYICQTFKIFICKTQCFSRTGFLFQASTNQSVVLLPTTSRRLGSHEAHYAFGILNWPTFSSRTPVRRSLTWKSQQSQVAVKVSKYLLPVSMLHSLPSENRYFEWCCSMLS